MIFVVRHGQTDWNKQKLMQGWADIPLNEVGLEQARLSGQKIKGVKFDVVFCSPLKRARQTLENLEIDSNDIKFDDRIKERNYGEYEKTPKMAFDYNEFWNYSLDVKYQKAESCKEFFDRVIDFLEYLKKDYEGKNVLIITHAGVTKVLKCYFDGFLKDEEIASYLPSNAEVLTYDL